MNLNNALITGGSGMIGSNIHFGFKPSSNEMDITNLKSIEQYINKIPNISKELNIPITLVAIDYVDINNGIMYKQNFNIVIGDTFNVENVSESIYKTKKFYKQTMTNFMKNKYKDI